VASNPITKVTAEEHLALDRAAEFRSGFLDTGWKCTPLERNDESRN
jgi:hypothetical protein